MNDNKETKTKQPLLVENGKFTEAFLDLIRKNHEKTKNYDIEWYRRAYRGDDEKEVG